MYRNSLPPSKLFGLVLLLFSGTALSIWATWFVTSETPAFDTGGLILLGLGTSLLILSLLFFHRVRWARIVMSVLTHLSALALGASLLYTLPAAETTAEHVETAAFTFVGMGLLFVAILVLHGDTMRSDFAAGPVRTSRPRWRRYLVTTAAGVLLLLALMTWRVVPLLTAEPTISVDYLAQANQISKPADYDPNRNAAPYYERLFSQLRPLPEVLREGRWKSWPTDLDPNQRRALDEWTAANGATLPILASAARCPYWWSELKSDSGTLCTVKLSYPEESRHGTWGVSLWAKYKASQGNTAEALQVLADLHMMGVQRIQAGRLNNQLVGAAVCRVCDESVLAILDHCTVAKDALERTLRVFAERLPQTRVPRFGELEELHGLDSIQLMFTDDGHGNGRLIPKQLYGQQRNRPGPFAHPIPYLDALRICLTHPDRRDTLLLYEMYVTLVNDLAQRTPWDLYVKNTSYEEQLQDLLSGNYYLASGSPSVGECLRVGWQDRVTSEATVATLAVFTYKAQEGRLPESLKEIVGKGLLPAVPMDPYSGAPLVYRVRDRDFTLYSVGEDFVDDGGIPCEWNDGFGGDHVFWPIPRPAEEAQEPSVGEPSR